MSTPAGAGQPEPVMGDPRVPRGPGAPRLAWPNETKPSFRTSELLAYLATLAGIIITCIALDGGDGEPDPFNANDALKYITWLTIGYMIARGLAKAGRRHYDENLR